MLLNLSLAPYGARSNHPGAAPGTPPPPCALPLFPHKVPAGFPSPAEEYAECSLDLNRYLVADPDATTFVRVPDAALHHRISTDRARLAALSARLDAAKPHPAAA